MVDLKLKAKNITKYSFYEVIKKKTNSGNLIKTFFNI